MKRFVIAVLLAAMCPAVAQSPTHLLVWWMTNYQPTSQQDKLPPGALVFMQDDNPETTDYHVTVYYRNHSSEPRWVEGFVRRARGYDGETKVWTTQFLRADDLSSVDNVVVFAVKVTGYKDQKNFWCCGE